MLRYGGWYTDLDTITFRPAPRLVNTLGRSGAFVGNGNLVLGPGGGFLAAVMRQADRKFTGKGWNSLGPVLVTETLVKVGFK